MGGYGSGRRNGKDTTEGYRALDIRRLHRRSVLEPGTTFTWHWTLNDEAVADINIRVQADCLNLSYRHSSGGSSWVSESYLVFLDRTGCHYGGQRTWFLCPARGCGRRVAVLYGGRVFACRNCNQLSYPSQGESPAYRALRKAQAIRQRLGGSGSMDEAFPEKPKGMHWRTYRRLSCRELWLDRRADSFAFQQFGLC